jgi:4'-phosphopantetheinyl transferase
MREAAPELAWLPIGHVSEVGRLGHWLTGDEQRRHEALRLPKRRRDWLAGRVAAKELVRRRHREDGFLGITVDAVAEGPDRGRPFYRLGAERGPFGLSISHSGDRAVAALGRRPGERVGVDLEDLIAGSPGFDELALSPPERERLPHADGETRVRTWVVKEALVKALGLGLRASLADVAVRFDPSTGAVVGLEVLGPSLPSIGDFAAGTFRLGEAYGAWVVLPPANEGVPAS